MFNKGKDTFLMLNGDMTAESTDNEGSKLKMIKMDGDTMMNYVRRKERSKESNTIYNVSLQNHTLHQIGVAKKKRRNEKANLATQRSSIQGPHILSLSCKPTNIAKP